MNHDDFRRNFSQSYLGIHPTAIVSTLKKLNLWDNLDFTGKTPPLIPATAPGFGHVTGCVTLVALCKNINDNDVISVQIAVPWKDDLDEDENFCSSLHPRIGMVETKDSIAFLRRVPKREYHRGYTPRSCNIYQPNSYTAEISRSGDYSVVWSVFNPNHRTLEEAVDILESGIRLGVPLSYQLGLCLENGRKFPLLVFRQEIIGFVQNGSDIVVYENTSPATRDYITKITGKIPKVK